MNQQDSNLEEAKSITLHQEGPTEVISTHGGVSLITRTFIVRKEDIAKLFSNGVLTLSISSKQEQGDETVTQ